MALSPPESIDADVAIIGAGFAGSLTALALAARGTRVALLERGRHPRFAIGESSTPLANLLLEEMADRYGLPGVRVFSKWGTWQEARPDVACGLKRGFTFFFHDDGTPWREDPARERQLMVAASPHDGVADTHWYRPDFDLALVRQAEEAGVLYLDETTLDGGRFGDGVVLEGTRHGRRLRVAAGFAIDASGPRGVLHRLLRLDETAPLRWLPATQALYAHFTGVSRWDARHAFPDPPPYPPDAAALHHVFEGGWIWVLRFNNGMTSAGAALTDARATAVRARDGADAWQRLLARLPAVRAQFDGAAAATPFVHASPLAFRSRQTAGRNWALLPSAAGVIDPLLSTGFPLTLLGVTRLLALLDGTRRGPAREQALTAYHAITQAELDATEQLVGALYAAMGDVPLFKQLTLLYFAAASFNEAARRLGRPHLAPGFLLHAHPRFGPELAACCSVAAARPQGNARAALLDRIDRAIEPFDIAGLLDRSRRDWYPVLASDLRGSTARLEATVAEVEALLARCGFAPR